MSRFKKILDNLNEVNTGNDRIEIKRGQWDLWTVDINNFYGTHSEDNPRDSVVFERIEPNERQVVKELVDIIDSMGVDRFLNEVKQYSNNENIQMRLKAEKINEREFRVVEYDWEKFDFTIKK